MHIKINCDNIMSMSKIKELIDKKKREEEELLDFLYEEEKYLNSIVN